MTEHPPLDLAYDARLQEHVLKLLRSAPHSFETLVGHCEGAYPTDVLAVLRKLQQAGSIKETRDKLWKSKECRTRRVEQEAETEHLAWRSQPEFPEAHPLDYDWRFDLRTLKSLDQKIEESMRPSVGILGAPTLFKYLVDRGRRPHLFDRNRQIVRFLRRSGYHAVTQCDLFRCSSGLRFECVVADPPWYLDYYRAFVATARKLLVPEGKLLLTMLPRLTRPSAEADREEIMTMICQQGFDLVGSEPGFLRYVSPPFEVEALKVEGLDLPAWRSGDLCTYVRTTREVVAWEDFSPEEGQDWRTFSIGPMIVKVRWDGAHRKGRFSFHNVPGAKGIRLRSVSRRSPLRSGIDLWTSRNLALTLTRPDLVCEGLELLLEGHGCTEIGTALMAAEKLNDAEVKQLNELLTILINEAKQ